MAIVPSQPELSPSVPLPPLSRVAIIGAGGPSGLVAIAQLLDKGVRPEQISAYEARDTAGGVWNYEQVAGKCEVSWRENGLAVCRTEEEIRDPAAPGPSAMYDKLRTNLPKQVMAYHNSPFPDDVPMFPSHRQVAAYLQDYAKNKGLLPIIQFSTLVRAVYHTSDPHDASQRWTVETDKDGKRDLEQFSHIIVANGHYNETFIPVIPGLRTWTGQLVHSRWWRNAEALRGKTVVVVGSRASGSDIARELATDGGDQSDRRIYQSVRVSSAKPQGGDGLWAEDLPWAKKIDVVSEIDRVEANVIHLKDGKALTGVDAIVFATGYLYSYPFFDSQPPFKTHPVTGSLAPKGAALPSAGGNTISNLDQSDIFYKPDPTLAFVGLHYLVNPFPLGEITARLIAHSFVQGEIPPLPPLLRNSGDPGDIRVGYPQEYINQDNWLRAIGEGDASTEGWHGIPLNLREMRANAPQLRKEQLGY